MKKFNRFVFLAVFTFTAGILTAQLNVQATRWAVPGKQINFNDYPAIVTTMTTGAVQDGINSYTYMDGPILFQIVDNQIKSVSGTNLATLGNSTGSRGPEYATTEVKNDCNTFLTFYLEREYTGLVTNEKLCYSKYSWDPVDETISMSGTNGYALQTEGSDAYGGIAMSKERPDEVVFYIMRVLQTGLAAILRNI
ncbi:MAG: hypothetical protein PHE33_10140 [Bacteroidales bacterium]|nr:hypothetical protein [Bacteroidales bacterium]